MQNDARYIKIFYVSITEICSQIFFAAIYTLHTNFVTNSPILVEVNIIHICTSHPAPNAVVK